MSDPVPRLRRLLAIIPLIQRRSGISLQELQDTLGVSRRELMGDLHAIMLCGVPPYLPNDYISVFIDGDHVTVDYAEHFARPARLTLREALALRLALERIPFAEEGAIADAGIELIDTLDRLMRRTLKAGEGSIAALEGRIEAPRAQGSGEKLSVIDRAIADRRPIVLTYYAPTSERVSRRRVRPYARGDKYGNHYLRAHCEDRDRVLTFRTDRISRIEPDERAPPFDVPQDPEAAGWLDAIGPRPGEGSTIRLRFDEAIARDAAEDHAEMRVEEDPCGDGGVIVDMTCGSLPWAVSRALLYGELAEILEPPDARAALVKRLDDWLAAPSPAR